MSTLPPDMELLVRNTVEDQVTRRLDGFGSLLKYVLAVIAALFAVFGLKTCSDITSSVKAVYESQLRARLDAVDSSTEITLYQNKLATLYRRALIDSALIRTQRQMGQYSSDRFRRPQVPAEDVNALLAIVRNPQTTDDDFATTLNILQTIAAKAINSDTAEIPSALNELLGRSTEILPTTAQKANLAGLSGASQIETTNPTSIDSNFSRGFRSSRRVAVIYVLGKLRYREAAQNVRGIMSDATASDEAKLAAIKYAGLVRDPEAIGSLIKFIASDNIRISKQARLALAVIQPTHATVKDWLVTLSPKSSMTEVAYALNIASSLSSGEEEENQRAFLNLEGDKSKRQSDVAQLFSDLIGIASKSTYQLRRNDSFFSDEGESGTENPPILPRNILLGSQENEGGYMVSSAFLTGGMAREETEKLLISAINDSTLPHILGFLGATTDPGHLSSLSVNLEKNGKVKLEDGRMIDNTVTPEVVILAAPSQPSKAAVFWRDPAGFTQNGSLAKIEGDFFLNLNILAK